MVLNLSGVMNPSENVMKLMGLVLRTVHRLLCAHPPPPTHPHTHTHTHPSEGSLPTLGVGVGGQSPCRGSLGRGARVDREAQGVAVRVVTGEWLGTVGDCSFVQLQYEVFPRAIVF